MRTHSLDERTVGFQLLLHFGESMGVAEIKKLRTEQPDAFESITVSEGLGQLGTYTRTLADSIASLVEAITSLKIQLGTATITSVAAATATTSETLLSTASHAEASATTTIAVTSASTTITEAAPSTTFEEWP